MSSEPTRLPTSTEPRSEAHQVNGRLFLRSLVRCGWLPAGLPGPTTKILPAPESHYAEDCDQQYVAKNTSGHFGLGATGMSRPAGVNFRAGH